MIELKNVSFKYTDSDEGVSKVNLTITAGECVVLTGPSGGGKTTITRLINGLAPSYYVGTLTGDITLDGKPLSQISHSELACQVGSVFQDPKSQFFSSELVGEVAFACENYGLAVEEIRERTDRAIDAFSLKELKEQNLDKLSSGEKQKVAISSVYALRPNIYVCDEPSSNLDKYGAEQLALILKKLKAEGSTLVIAEHRLSWLHGIADRFIYVKDGKIRWEKSALEMEQISAEQRKVAGLREVIESERDEKTQKYTNSSPSINVIQLSLHKKKKNIFYNVNLSLHPGEVTAITGHNGVGKTSLALVLTGLCKESNGIIMIGGRKTCPAERRKQVWYSSNDTGTQFFTNSVTEELLLHHKRSEERLERTRSILKQLGLYQYKDAHPASLSGGQKQRLSIACGIVSDRPILIFDEPTSGLDGGNMEIVAMLLKEAAALGKTILVITHDNELIHYCCNHIIALDNS